MNIFNLYKNNIEDLKELRIKLIELKRYKMAERVEKVIKEMEVK